MKRRHKVVATNAQIQSALARARAFAANDRRLCSAFYDRNADRICLVLPDEIQVSIPRRQFQGLANATPGQLSEIELVGGGTGIHGASWPPWRVVAECC
jgi:predicted TPR repeat methyltransferase